MMSVEVTKSREHMYDFTFLQENKEENEDDLRMVEHLVEQSSPNNGISSLCLGRDSVLGQHPEPS